MAPPSGAPTRSAPGAQAEQWAPRPQRIKHHRTVGDVVKGLGALLALVALIGVIPFALIRYIGWPLPHHMPDAEFFKQAITPDVLLKALAVIVWVAWAQFVACVVVEFAAARRGVGLPARVPAAGPSQFLARQLIAALLMITASAASFVPDLAHLHAQAGPPALRNPITGTAGAFPGAGNGSGNGSGSGPTGAGHGRTSAAFLSPVNARGLHPQSGNGTGGGAGSSADANASAGTGVNLPTVRGEAGLRLADDSFSLVPDSGGSSNMAIASMSTKLYRVQPPHGRHHDSLWEIAQRHLGDGRRYKEIYELNKDRVQPDGSKLTIASLIRPGWILTMPADATGGDLVTEPAPQALPGGGGSTPAPTPTPTQPGPRIHVPLPPEDTAPPTQSPSPSPSQTPSTAPSTAPPTTAPPTTTPSASPSAGPSQSPSPSPSASPTDPESFSPAPSDPSTTSHSAPAPDPSPSETTAPMAPINPNGPAALTPVPSFAPPPLPNPWVPPADTSQPVVTVQSADEIAEIASAAAERAHLEIESTGSGSAAEAEAEVATVADSESGTFADSAPAAALAAVPAPALPAASAPALELEAASAPIIAPATPLDEGVRLDDPESEQQPGTVAHQDGTAPARSSHRGTHAPEESQPPSVDNRVLFGLAGAPLLAAGLYKALGRHRRRQLFNRVSGRRPVTPTGDAAVAEESIRIGSREVEVWFLDLALRGLSASLAEADHPIPDAYAVKLRTEGIELMLSRPSKPDDPVQPPEPWEVAGDGRSWSFSRPRITDVDAQSAHRRFAPYPGLVTIGGVGTDRIMIDLEEARGVVGFGGHRERRRAALAALAVELATNSWSDRMTVTLVGFPGDLTPLAPARVRHVATLDDLMPALEAEAAERVTALAAAGLASVLDGRSRASQAGSFPPHFVVVADEPHPATMARLVDIAATASRVGMGFAVAGDVPGAAWQLEVSSEGRLSARQLGIDVDAQLLPDDQYVAVLGLFRTVCDIEGTELPTGLVHQSVGYGGPLPDEPPAVFAAMLGPLELSGTSVADSDKAPLLREALVFLLHHRDGVHPRVLAAALWPLGATATVAEATFARLASWLGDDPHGEPNLLTDEEGRLRLGQYVWSDWDMFQSLQSRALYDPAAGSREQRDQLLRVALDLVRGPFLADREAGRYGWLAYEVAEAQIPAIVADTSLRLADSLTSAGLAEDAIEAVKAGMRGSPDDEELWRGLLRATAATGDAERLHGAVEGLYKRTWYVHGVQGLHPHTEALVDELLPAWREVVVG